MFDHIAESLFSLLVVEQGLFIESNGLVTPVNDELIREDILVNQLFHEGLSVLRELVLVDSHEVEHNRLHEVVDSDLTLCLYQLQEHSLALFPVFNDIP